MSNDVLITPASRKIEFKDSGGTVDAKIETDSSGNLTITNPGGDISIGDTTADVFIGDGVNSIDIVFEQNGEIRGTSGVTLTLGDSNTTLKTGTSLDIAGSGALQVGGLNVITSARNMQNIGNINIGGYYAMDGTTLIDTGKNIVNVNQITTLSSLNLPANSSSLGIYAGSTQVFQGSTRNLVNIGTISSGAITSSSTIQGGQLKVSTASPVVVINDSDATNATNQVGYISFQRQGVEKAWIGYGSSGNDDFSIRNTEGAITLLSNLEATGTITIQKDDFDAQLVIQRPHASNSAAITFKNNTGQAGILYAQQSDGALRWRDGTSSNTNKVFHEGFHPNADKWTTARTLSLTGAIEGSVSWDGSANASLATKIHPMFSTSYSATPSTRWVKFERPFLTGNGSSNFYSFRVVGYKQFGNEKSYQDYDVYIHIRSNGTTTNIFDITVTKKTPETDNEFSFAYRQPLDSGLTNRENEFYIVMDGTYSGIQIYPNHNVDGAFVELTSSMFSSTDTQPQQLTGITVDEFLTNQNPKVKGTLEFTGSAVYNALDLNNNNIIGVNNITINDSGTSEGIQWTNWHIYESPNDLSNANGNLQIVNGGTRRATFASTGLEVVDGTIKVTKDQDTLANVLSNGTYAAEFLSTDSGNTGHATGIILSGSSGTNRGASIVAQAQSSGNDHDLIFATSASAATPTEAMRITSDNKVGIGVNPARELDVGGGIQVRNGDMLRYYVSSWANATTHSVLSNSFKNTLGDYITLKAAGNNTSAHGAIVVADNGIFFGRTNIETGDLVANNSVTAPLDANWARIDTSGVLHCNRVSITNNATPLIFNQADQSNGTVGKWWRMPIDGTQLRFDVSLTGDGAFTTYRDVFTITAAGDAKLGGGGASDYNKLYFSRYGGASVGAIGWHSDAIFYIGGHPSYGSNAGNDVRVYGFGSDIHIGDNSNGDVITVKYDTGDVLVQAGTAASDPAVVRILSKTESNTDRGQYYAGLEFGVVGGEAGSGDFTNGVNTAIRAVDCRNGSTSYEDSGLGFYTTPSTGRTTPALRVVVANEGGMHVTSDGTPENMGAGDFAVDGNIGVGTTTFTNASNTNGVLAIGSAFIASSASLFVDGFSRYSGPLYVSQNSANGGNYFGLTYSNNRLTLNKSGSATSSIDAPDGYYVGNTAVITSSRALDNITGLDVDTTTSSAVTFNSSAHNGIKYTLTDTVADQAFYGMHIDYNASGSDACTADRIHAALFIDADSSASGGDTADEHRFYGIYGDVRVSQDSDQVHGSYWIARADNFGTGKSIANVRGHSGLAYGHQDAGTISNVQGAYNYAINNSSGSGVVTSVMGSYNAALASSTSVNATNYYGVYSICQVTATQTVNPTSLHAVYGEIQFDNDTAADHAITVANAYVIRAEYDENDSDDSYTVNNGYLFFGNYSGTLPTTAYGVYISENSSSIRNRMGGTLEANDGSLSQVSYGFIGDINTGMYSPADHELSFATNGTRRININSSGNVGIGSVATSTEKLSVAGSFATSSGSITSFGNITAGNGYVQANTGFQIGSTSVINSSRQLVNLTFTGGSAGVRFARDTDLQDTGGVKRLRFNATGASAYNSTNGHFFQNGGTNKAQIDTSGNAIFAGNVTAYGSPSDINLKENIETIPNAVEKVQKLDGVTFNYKKDGGRSTGLIAQQLQEVLPEVVYTAKDLEGEEHLAVRYGNVVGLLVEALKEQQTQIDNLTALVNELKEK